MSIEESIKSSVKRSGTLKQVREEDLSTFVKVYK